MKMNPKKIKESLAKGFVLLTLTGTLVSKDPININKENIVYAATDLTSVKKDSIKELKSIYKKYNKSYYSSKNYNKLTKYYNKAVNLINNAKSLEKIESYLETYKVKLESIKPTKLIKYQNKMEKSLLKTYKALISKYEYSDYNLQEIEDIKNEGLESIYSALTKTKSKKAKNSYINKLKEVKTLIQQVKEDAYRYINNSRLSNEEKENLINQIENINEEENITSLLEEYGYKYKEEYIETNPNKLTLDILNNDEKLNEFEEKWYDNSDHTFLYSSSTGQRRSLSTLKLDFLIKAINYQYVDSNKTKERFYSVYYDETSTFERFKQEMDVVVYYLMKLNERGVSQDYDSLIIENDQLKGVGKLIQKMVDNCVDKKDISNVYTAYMDKYMGINYTLDAIVETLLFKHVSADFQNTENNRIIILMGNKKKFKSILEEYFYGTIDEYESYAQKQKKLTK